MNPDPFKLWCMLFRLNGLTIVGPGLCGGGNVESIPCDSEIFLLQSHFPELTKLFFLVQPTVQAGHLMIQCGESSRYLHHNS